MFWKKRHVDSVKSLQSKFLQLTALLDKHRVSRIAEIAKSGSPLDAQNKMLLRQELFHKRWEGFDDQDGRRIDGVLGIIKAHYDDFPDLLDKYERDWILSHLGLAQQVRIDGLRACLIQERPGQHFESFYTAERDLLIQHYGAYRSQVAQLFAEISRLRDESRRKSRLKWLSNNSVRLVGIVVSLFSGSQIILALVREYAPSVMAVVVFLVSATLVVLPWISRHVLDSD